jgi:bifunctional non-homologous end joining protein LigD
VAKQDRLDAYRAKRDPARTPEPVPGEGPLPRGGDDTYVIQEHHARRLHWDLRLERGGVLVSWAIPKGLPHDPKTNHLAVHTEDHPLEYASFSGEIPKGEYGGGTMTIWDRGTYETEKWNEREVMVILHGSRASGRYVLFQTGDRNWMIHRMDPADAEPMPSDPRPVPYLDRARLPRDQDRYGFEFDWGGLRTFATVDGGQARFSEVKGPSGLGPALGSRRVVLDGEMVTVDGRELFMAFDLLYLDDRSLVDEPYERRREALDDLRLAGPRWQTAPWFPGEGAAVRQAALGQGLPGVIAKPLDGPYHPGRVCWLRIGVKPPRDRGTPPTGRRPPAGSRR